MLHNIDLTTTTTKTDSIKTKNNISSSQKSAARSRQGGLCILLTVRTGWRPSLTYYSTTVRLLYWTVWVCVWTTIRYPSISGKKKIGRTNIPLGTKHIDDEQIETTTRPLSLPLFSLDCCCYCCRLLMMIRINVICRRQPCQSPTSTIPMSVIIIRFGHYFMETRPRPRRRR